MTNQVREGQTKALALIGSLLTGYQLVYHEYGKRPSWLKDLMN